jgi:hypothetical protein
MEKQLRQRELQESGVLEEPGVWKTRSLEER